MEETEFLRDFEGIKDYRTFLVGLDKQFKSAGACLRTLRPSGSWRRLRRPSARRYGIWSKI